MLSPCPLTVTTRIIAFLVGHPQKNLYLPLLLGGGTTQYKSISQLQPPSGLVSSIFYQKKKSTLGNKKTSTCRAWLAHGNADDLMTSEVQGQKVNFPSHGRWSYRWSLFRTNPGGRLVFLGEEVGRFWMIADLQILMTTSMVGKKTQKLETDMSQKNTKSFYHVTSLKHKKYIGQCWWHASMIFKIVDSSNFLHQWEGENCWSFPQLLSLASPTQLIFTFHKFIWESAPCT